MYRHVWRSVLRLNASDITADVSDITADSGRGETEEHGDGPSETRHVVVGQTS